MYKMLFISIDGEWIPVMESIAKDNLATHVVINTRHLRDMTEEDWISVFAEQNNIKDVDSLRFFSFA